MQAVVTLFTGTMWEAMIPVLIMFGKVMAVMLAVFLLYKLLRQVVG